VFVSCVLAVLCGLGGRLLWLGLAIGTGASLCWVISRKETWVLAPPCMSSQKVFVSPVCCALGGERLVRGVRLARKLSMPSPCVLPPASICE
jgi:hypothetical protein